MTALLLAACTPAESPSAATTESGTTVVSTSTAEIPSTTNITTTNATTAPATATTATTPPATSTAPENPVRFAADEVSDGLMRLTLDNGETSAIGYNLCSSDLERNTGSNWERVASDEVCTQQMLALNPGQDATFEKRLPIALPAGEYRYSTRIENPFGGGFSTITTKPFKR